jgi:hypothetical protein
MGYDVGVVDVPAFVVADLGTEEGAGEGNDGGEEGNDGAD